MLKRLAFFWLFCLLVFTVDAQQSKIKIQASPLDAIVLLDGDTLGLANDKSVYVGFNERKGIYKHHLTFVSKGYEREVVELNLDTPPSENLKVDLSRQIRKVSGEEDYTVDINDVISGIEYGTSIGKNDRWFYRYNTGVLDVRAKDQLHMALDRANLKLADSSGSQLLYQDSAHLMVSGFVEEYEIKKGLKSQNYAGGSRTYTGEPKVRWVVFDRVNGDTIWNEQLKSDFEFRGNASYGFHDAVVDNFYLALNDPQLVALLSAYQPHRINEVHAEEIVETPIDSAEDSVLVTQTITSQDSMVNEEDSISDEDTKTPAAEESNSITVETLAQTESKVTTTVGLAGGGIKANRTQPKENALLLSSKRGNDKYALEKGVVSVMVDGQPVCSGAVIGSAGYVLAGCLLQKRNVSLRFSNGVLLEAELIRSVEKENLTLLKVSASDIVAHRLSDPKSLTSGSQLIMLTRDESDVFGRLPAKYTLTQSGDSEIEIDAELSNQEAGGPLLNRRGEIYGIYQEINGTQRIVNAQHVMNVLNLSYED